MQKILLPEANNDFIQTALPALRKFCEPEATAMELAAACQQLKAGTADAMLAGIDWSSRDVILACRDELGMLANHQVFSSLFVVDLPDGRRYILSDGATCKHPTVSQLTEIVELVHAAAEKLLDDTPRVALLSFSSFGSGGKDATIDLARDVLAELHQKHPQMLVDGEMQLDAAVNPRIAEKKAPADSPVAGRANVLIAPDINAGNILYKAFEQFASAKVAGPILLGFQAPVSDLSRGSTVEDIVFTAQCLLRLASPSQAAS